MTDKYQLMYNSYLNSKIKYDFELNKRTLRVDSFAHKLSKREEFLVSASSINKEKDADQAIEDLLKNRCGNLPQNGR
jgi:hypothetical protein